MNTLLAINWEEQWSAHAPGFREGRAHIPLTHEIDLPLLPGPGFGDSSHPTTRLMLTLLAPLIPGHEVFDIGCGSGILSVASAKLGATKVYACDIDSDALEHTRKNGEINQVELAFSPPPPSSKPVILMNMIASEQKEAWGLQKRPFTHLITSGILATDKTSYLSFAEENHWQILHEEELEGWMGFVIKEKS